jgi:hypothetical protein
MKLKLAGRTQVVKQRHLSGILCTMYPLAVFDICPIEYNYIIESIVSYSCFPPPFSETEACCSHTSCQTAPPIGKLRNKYLLVVVRSQPVGVASVPMLPSARRVALAAALRAIHTTATRGRRAPTGENRHMLVDFISPAQLIRSFIYRI